jgi:hypothetical protein
MALARAPDRLGVDLEQELVVGELAPDVHERHLREGGGAGAQKLVSLALGHSATLDDRSSPVDRRGEMRNDPSVRFIVEHFRAVEADELPLGVAYVPTGKVDQVDAHDPPAAAAIALSEGEDLMDVDLVSYDPGDDLYGVAGDDEAVRVKSS